MITRCDWCGDDPLYVRYHDEEWGVPCTDEHKLFEFLILEGAQAGLAWITVLRKREGYRKLFANFDPHRVARLTDRDLQQRLQNPAIIRNRLKVFSARQNARAFLAVQAEKGSFADYLWAFVDGTPIQGQWNRHDQIPAYTPLSDQISKDLKQRGFTFVGSTIVYAYLQAMGLVNDHLRGCFRHAECRELGLPGR